MKKILTSALLSATILGAGLAISSHVSAATDPQSEKTDGSVTFEAGTDPTKPVDPTDPDVDPGDGDPDGGDGGTGETGPLEIAYATKTVSFGTDKTVGDGSQDNAPIVKISSAKQTLYANHYVAVEVADTRGTAAGWTLNASASDFTNDDEVLKGAELTFAPGTVTVANGGDQATAAKADTVVKTGTALSAVAGKDKGVGLTVDKIAAADATLTIPAGSAKVGKYSAFVTWTLTDTPGV
ncbi:WxL domain-containing protein [Dellaglioa sp. BT-FLS60]